MLTRERRPEAPLFELFTLDELAEKTPYSLAYLVALKVQPKRITPRFRANVSLMLGKTEQELFGPAPEERDGSGVGVAEQPTAKGSNEQPLQHFESVAEA